jgi:hypothetical protein
MGGVEILMIIVRRPRTVKAIARVAAVKVRQMCVPHITCTIHKIMDGT